MLKSFSYILWCQLHRPVVSNQIKLISFWWHLLFGWSWLLVSSHLSPPSGFFFLLFFHSFCPVKDDCPELFGSLECSVIRSMYVAEQRWRIIQYIIACCVSNIWTFIVNCVKKAMLFHVKRKKPPRTTEWFSSNACAHARTHRLWESSWGVVCVT